MPGQHAFKPDGPEIPSGIDSRAKTGRRHRFRPGAETFVQGNLDFVDLKPHSGAGRKLHHRSCQTSPRGISHDPNPLVAIKDHPGKIVLVMAYTIVIPFEPQFPFSPNRFLDLTTEDETVDAIFPISYPHRGLDRLIERTLLSLYTLPKKARAFTPITKGNRYQHMKCRRKVMR